VPAGVTGAGVSIRTEKADEYRTVERSTRRDAARR
jgi:hypothetical protein